MRLTPKKILFCHEFLKDRNPSEAALRAGFKKSYIARIAKKILLDPDIQAKIDDLLKQSPPTKDWVLERLREEALHARADTARVRALGTLAQSLGMLKDSHLEKDLIDIKQILMARERANRTERSKVDPPLDLPNPLESRA